jgi:hypothetical protein
VTLISSWTKWLDAPKHVDQKMPCPENAAVVLGKRKPKQASLWLDARHLQAHPAHPLSRRLNEILERARFDRYVERLCRKC